MALPAHDYSSGAGRRSCERRACREHEAAPPPARQPPVPPMRDLAPLPTFCTVSRACFCTSGSGWPIRRIASSLPRRSPTTQRPWRWGSCVCARRGRGQHVNEYHLWCGRLLSGAPGMGPGGMWPCRCVDVGPNKAPVSLLTWGWASMKRPRSLQATARVRTCGHQGSASSRWVETRRRGEGAKGRALQPGHARRPARAGGRLFQEGAGPFSTREGGDFMQAPPGQAARLSAGLQQLQQHAQDLCMGGGEGLAREREGGAGRRKGERVGGGADGRSVEVDGARCCGSSQRGNGWRVEGWRDGGVEGWRGGCFRAGAQPRLEVALLKLGHVQAPPGVAGVGRCPVQAAAQHLRGEGARQGGYNGSCVRSGNALRVVGTFRARGSAGARVLNVGGGRTRSARLQAGRCRPSRRETSPSLPHSQPVPAKPHTPALDWALHRRRPPPPRASRL